jgi:integrase
MAPLAAGQVIERETQAGRVFALRFRAYGQRRYLTLGTGWTRERAELELANVLADVRRGTWRPPEPEPVAPDGVDEPTFHEFASEWYAARLEELRPRTAEDYEWALRCHLLPFFARHRLSEITIREVDRYRTTKLREGALSAGTLNKTITRLAQVLELAVEYGHLSANPARGRRRRVKAPPPRRTWLEPEHVKPLVDAASVRLQRGGKTSPTPRDRALAATAICAGLRIGELLALRWRDVDLAGGGIRVGDSKTEAGVRTVDLWPELSDELATYKASLGRTPMANQFVFGTRKRSGQRGPRIAEQHGQDTRQNVRKRLNRWVERAAEELEGLDDVPALPESVTPHSFRRTFAALLYLRGEDPVYVMEQLGHSDPKLALRIYTKVIGDRRRRGRGERLVAVVRGVEWAPMGTKAPGAHDDALAPLLARQENIAH